MNGYIHKMPLYWKGGLIEEKEMIGVNFNWNQNQSENFGKIIKGREEEIEKKMPRRI